MFYFRSLYTTIFLSSLVVLDAASIQNLELEFTKKYPNPSTYTRWRELDKIGELQLKLVCTRSYGPFNPATQFIVKALRLHDQKVKFSSAMFSEGYVMIRLDLLECDVKLVNSGGSKGKSRIFFLAEGTEMGQLFKLVRVHNSLHLVGVSKVILSQVHKPKHRIASSTSPARHPNTPRNVQEAPEISDITEVIDPFPPLPLHPEESPPLQPVTGAQIEESFTQDSGVIDPELNRHELDEQENLYSQYFLDYLAHAYHESQPPVRPINSLPYPPLQSMNRSQLQLLSEGQIGDPFLTGSTILENHTNFGIPSQKESPQYHLNNTNNTLAGSFQETSSPQLLPSQAIFQPVSKVHVQGPPYSISSVAPENKQNISKLNRISSALRNLSSKYIQIDPLNSLSPTPPALPIESSIQLPNQVEMNNFTSNQNALPQYYVNTLESVHQELPMSDVIMNSSPSSMSSLVQSQQPYQGFSTGDGFHHPGYANMGLPKQFPLDHRIDSFPPDLPLDSSSMMHQLLEPVSVLDSSEKYLYNHDTDSARDAVKSNYPEHNQMASAHQNSYANLQQPVLPDRGIDLISQSLTLDSSLMVLNEPYQTDSPRDAIDQNETTPNMTASTFQDVYGENYGGTQQLSLSDYGIDPSPAPQSRFKEWSSQAASKQQTGGSHLRRSARRPVSPAYLQEFVH